MKFKKFIILLILSGILLHFHAYANNGEEIFSVIWYIDNVDSIESHPTTKLGEPEVIETSEGPAVLFDGIDDGLIVISNPLENATSFTIEVIFKPDSSYPNNQAQRFIHIQNPGNDDRRILIELRLTDDHQWYLDTFIKSELSSLTLQTENALHPVGEWYHAALVYENRIMKHYVDGEEELSGEVDFLPISGGYTSIGTRMNQRSWFKGAIRTLKVTHRVLSPDEFLIHDTGIRDNELIVSDFVLFQNYPNPFNPSTNIYYNIPVYGQVELSIYDVTGRRVVELYNGNQAAGEYSYNWQAVDVNRQQLTSGVYFLHIKTEKYHQTVKMMYTR